MIRASVVACTLVLAGSQIAFGTLYSGNGNSGFGGTVGGSSLVITDDGVNVYFSFSRGGGNLNDALVLYLDTTAGGFSSTSSFTDSGDGLRNAISGTNNSGGTRTTVNFATGMTADYAIAFDAGFGGLWSLTSGGSHGFVNSVGLSPTGNSGASTHTFSTSMASIGLVPGGAMRFVGTYISTTAWRSDEAYGAGVGVGNPGDSGTISFTNFHTYTAVPEASSFLFAGAIAALAFSRRSARSKFARFIARG
ncbi:MAG: hypothetical protein KF688_16090 [Pirellulales bacterium]|nr:hypothetical protein [Pirellulales bacterium]